MTEPHTPGPWTVEPISDGCFEVKGPTRDDGFAGGYRWFGEADANLIAAAPELLDALKVVQWAWRSDYQYCACCGRYKVDGHNAVCRVATAIAKAEGK